MKYKIIGTSRAQLILVKKVNHACRNVQEAVVCGGRKFIMMLRTKTNCRKTSGPATCTPLGLRADAYYLTRDIQFGLLTPSSLTYVGERTD